MATPGTLTTPRGQRTVYMHIRDNSDLDYSAPDYIYNSESDESSEDDYDGILAATLTNFTDADFDTYDGNVLTYNPITDNYSIVPGEYIL